VYLMPASSCDCKTCNGGTPAPKGVFGGSHCSCPCHNGAGDQNNPSPFIKMLIDMKVEEICNDADNEEHN